MANAGKAILTRDGLDLLIAGLGERGYRVVGPRVRDQAIVYDDIDGVADLPEGWTDRQQARPCSAMSSARIPGRSISIRRASVCGGRSAGRTE